MQTTATPVPTPKRSKRRWYFVGGFVLLLLATPIIYVLITGWWSGRELEQIYREMDAEDSHWRWDDLIAEMPAVPDNQNAFVQMQKVMGPLNSCVIPAWFTDAEKESRVAPNARLAAADAEMLRAVYQPLGPAALAEVRKLKDRPKGHIKRNPAFNFYFEWGNVHQASYVMVCLGSDAIVRAHDKDFAGAAESWHALINTSHAIDANPSADSQRTRMYGQQLAVETLERLLGQGEWSEGELAKVQALLQRDVGVNLLHLGSRGERARSHQTYLDLRAGNISKEVRQLIAADANENRTGNPIWDTIADLFPGIRTGGYPDFLRLLNEFVQASQLKDEDRLQAIEQIEKKVRANQHNFMIRVFMPWASTSMAITASAQLAHEYHHTQAQLRCAMAAAAVERYRMRHDAWPQGFDDLLKEGWLDAIPKDPYDGKPLRFKRTPTGFVIYSVGFNRVDNEKSYLDRNIRGHRVELGFELWDRQLRAIAPAVEQEK